MTASTWPSSGAAAGARDHIGIYGKLPNSRVAAICDIDQAQRERAVQFAEQAQGAKPADYDDLRRVLDNKDIDAVSIATCNHWHALATIWACQAGKDVYVEKPASHNIFEGRKMVEAARKYNRIVQVGMQSRTIEHKQRAIQMLREGAIGKVYMAKGLCFKRRKIHRAQRPTAPFRPASTTTAGSAPRPCAPFNPNRFHYNWHWFWDTGNGDIGNQGVHEMDIARWGLGKSGLPTTRCLHRRQVRLRRRPGDAQHATRHVRCTATASWCSKSAGLLTGGRVEHRADGDNYIGNIFFGSEGYLAVDSTGCQVYKGEKRELAQKVKSANRSLGHRAPHAAISWTPCAAASQTDLHADIEEGHLSAALVPPGQHQLPHGAQTQSGPGQREFRHRRRSQRADHATLPRALRRARESVGMAKGSISPAEHSTYRDRATGAVIHQMTAHPAISHPTYFLHSSFTADSRALFFISYRAGSAQLFEAAYPDGEIRQLTDGAAIHPYSPALHPDGRRIFFVRGGEVWSVDRETLAEARIAAFAGATIGRDAPSAEVAEWITAAVRQGGQAGIAAGRADGSDWRLIPFPRTVIHPQFHPPNRSGSSSPPIPRRACTACAGTAADSSASTSTTTTSSWCTRLFSAGTATCSIPCGRTRLRVMDWKTRSHPHHHGIQRWHITPNRAGTLVLCDTNHPDLGMFLIDALTGERRQVCLTESGNQRHAVEDLALRPGRGFRPRAQRSRG